MYSWDLWTNHFSNLSSLRRGLREPPTLESWMVRNTRSLDLTLVSEVGAVLWNEVLHLWDLMLTPGSSPQTELNYRTSSWVWRTGLWCWESSLLQHLVLEVMRVENRRPLMCPALFTLVLDPHLDCNGTFPLMPHLLLSLSQIPAISQCQEGAPHVVSHKGAQNAISSNIFLSY